MSETSAQQLARSHQARLSDLRLGPNRWLYPRCGHCHRSVHPAKVQITTATNRRQLMLWCDHCQHIDTWQLVHERQQWWMTTATHPKGTPLLPSWQQRGPIGALRMVVWRVPLWWDLWRRRRRRRQDQ